MRDPENYTAAPKHNVGLLRIHNGLTGCGKIFRILTVHQLETRRLPPVRQTWHTARVFAVLYPAWAKYVYKYDIPRFLQFANRVWNVVETFENMG
jgi:alcohol dehydrogenase YqhD (iron-dependent ADH family)